MTSFTKAEARKHFTAKRKELSIETVSVLSKKIHDLLFSRLMIHRYSPIHVFFPIVKNNEVDTSLIINTLQKDFSPDLFVSKCEQNGELLHHLYVKNTILSKNKWGIPEPETENPGLYSEGFFDKYQAEDILVLIPLLGFDKVGQRVGYGKGFYDRFLANATKDTIKVGLSFFEPIDKIIDTNEQDIKLDYAITPERVWTW
jgi:5-formyltetrahydrofolate cyclo-ligase